MIMNETQEGFFNEAEMDRLNAKTMANELPEGYNGCMLLSMLSTKHSEIYSERKDDLVARRQVIDWYCQATADQVALEIDRYKDNDEYKGKIELMKLMHSIPKDKFNALMEEIAKGDA